MTLCSVTWDHQVEQEPDQNHPEVLLDQDHLILLLPHQENQVLPTPLEDMSK